MPPSDKPTLAADALLAVAPLTSRWMERLLAGHDPPLTLAQYLALRAVRRGTVVAAELARRTGVSGPAISQLVAGLANAGLLDRRPAADDRRRQELALSAAGRAVLDSADDLMRDRVVALLAELPRPEADALARALPHVEALLSGTAPPRRPPPPRPGPGGGGRGPRRRPGPRHRSE